MLHFDRSGYRYLHLAIIGATDDSAVETIHGETSHGSLVLALTLGEFPGTLERFFFVRLFGLQLKQLVLLCFGWSQADRKSATMLT
jgi:hypothetical protein